MRSYSVPQLVCLVAFGLHVLAYLDVPWLTFGHRFLVRRWNEQLVLMSAELNMILIWAMLRLVLHWDAPIVPEPAAGTVAWLGAALTVAGVGLAVSAKLRLGRWFSSSFGVKPGHELVTDGPYAIVRHPIYAGILAAAVGIALAWNSAITLALAVLFAVPLTLHTAVEEMLFVEHFGDAYREYQRRVPRLVPAWRGRKG